MDITNKLEFSSKIFQLIIQKLTKIDSFKGSWTAIELNQSKHLRELKKIATIESIGSSTRIEGATLTDKEVESLLKQVKIKKFTTRDEEEVAGYYDTLKIILENWNTINLSENNIHHLHSILLKYSNKDQNHKGRYKNVSNKFVANYPDGTQRTIFNPTEPHLTSDEMSRVIAYIDEQTQKNEIHPILLTALFVYEFLSIHPYQDGNGRLSRLLTTLLLIQNGYQFIQYVSFENIIEIKKDEYYRALMNGQQNRNTSNENIETWVLFFLDCIIELIRRLEEKYKIYNQLDKGLNQRQKDILQTIKISKSCQIGDLEVQLNAYSRNTIKKDVVVLLSEGLILKMGAGRSVRYYAKES